MNFVDIAARNENGTLLCICGKPGTFFVHAFNKVVDGKTYGVLRGICSDTCLHNWKSGEIACAPVPTVFQQPKMFG